MTEAGPAPPDDDAAASEAALAADWRTIWQSEWAALAEDREMREAWHRLAETWASLPAAPPAQAAVDAAARPARPQPPPGSPAPADAPHARRDADGDAAGGDGSPIA